MRQLYTDMQDFLPKLALDEDQEVFILDHIEKTSHESSSLNEASAELGATLLSVVNTLQYIIDKQQNLASELKFGAASQPTTDKAQNASSDIDLFSL